MASGGQGGTESRLIGWKNAVDVCNDVWDKWLQAYNDAIQRSIDALEQHIDFLSNDPDSEGQEYEYISQLRRDIEAIGQCKSKVNDAFDATREKALDSLGKSLLKASPNAKRTIEFVASRNDKNIERVKPNERKKRKRTSTKRRHVRTGRPRGWNMKRINAALGRQRAGRMLSVRERRRRRRARRKVFKQEQKANNFIRSIRRLKHEPHGRHRRVYWKPYPARRAQKVPGWLTSWLQGY